jgi:hypothetical protein
MPTALMRIAGLGLPSAGAVPAVVAWHSHSFPHGPCDMHLQTSKLGTMQADEILRRDL